MANIEVRTPEVQARKVTGEKPLYQLPKGSIDSHMHLYAAQYPGQKGGPAPPADQAGIEMYQKVQQWLGLERVVIVQANAHQADNSCLLNGLSHFGDKARGVAAVKANTSESQLQDLHNSGVRAARIMELNGAVGMQDLLAVNQLINSFNWSCIVQFDGKDMLKHTSSLKQLQGNYVIDHTGKYLQPVDIKDPTFTALLTLIDKGNCYVKLAGCYETSRSGAPFYEDLAAMSKALLKHAPERVIWGSNWPHVSLAATETPDDGTLLNLACDWMGDEQTMQKVFIDNPSRLYGFI
ncbi:MAG: amidohydrolase family protein [Oceanospirillaceae bacterium]